ncbi:MAG: CHASE3 domain-containing protein [Lacibacter sp.]
MNPIQNLNIAQRIYSFLIGRLAERILISASIAVFITILFVVLIFIKATNQSKKASAEIEHAQEIIKHTSHLQRLVTEYESATKGFLINENMIYLEKREETDKELKAHTILLSLLFEKEIAAHKKRYQTLTTLIQDKNSFLDSLFKLHRAGQKNVAVNLLNKSQDVDYATRIKLLTNEIEHDQAEMVSFSQKKKNLRFK